LGSAQYFVRVWHTRYPVWWARENPCT